jgi:hypothetical protein
MIDAMNPWRFICLDFPLQRDLQHVYMYPVAYGYHKLAWWLGLRRDLIDNLTHNSDVLSRFPADSLKDNADSIVCWRPYVKKSELVGLLYHCTVGRKFISR